MIKTKPRLRIITLKLLPINEKTNLKTIKPKKLNKKDRVSSSKLLDIRKPLLNRPYILFDNKEIKEILERIIKTIEKTQEIKLYKKHSNSILNKFKEVINRRLAFKDNMYSITLFACMKHLLSEFNNVSNEQIDLLLNLFYKGLYESENQWKTLINVMIDTISNIEQRIISLEEAIKIKDENIDKILKSTELSEEYKIIIENLQKNLNNERNMREKLEVKINILENDMKLSMIQWDKIKSSDRIINKLNRIEENILEQMFNFDKNMKDDEKALKLNIERLIMAYPEKHPFIQEREQYKEKLEEKDKIIVSL